MWAILMRLALTLFAALMALIVISLFTGQLLDASVDLYVYSKQGMIQHLILAEPDHAIRLDFNAAHCLDSFFLRSDEQNFESLTDFYAWSATHMFTIPAVEALAIIQCRWQAAAQAGADWLKCGDSITSDRRRSEVRFMLSILCDSLQNCAIV